MTTENFRKTILEGIPRELPAAKPFDFAVSHAPRRKDILNLNEKKLALKNALRYFPEKFNAILASEFLD